MHNALLCDSSSKKHIINFSAECFLNHSEYYFTRAVGKVSCAVTLVLKRPEALRHAGRRISLFSFLSFSEM